MTVCYYICKAVFLKCDCRFSLYVSQNRDSTLQYFSDAYTILFHSGMIHRTFWWQTWLIYASIHSQRLSFYAQATFVKNCIIYKTLTVLCLRGVQFSFNGTQKTSNIAMIYLIIHNYHFFMHVLGARKRKQNLQKENKTRPRSDDGVIYTHESCASIDCCHPRNVRNTWVQCDDCDKWFHLKCAGLSDKAASRKENLFHCGCS